MAAAGRRRQKAQVKVFGLQSGWRWDMLIARWWGMVIQWNVYQLHLLSCLGCTAHRRGNAEICILSVWKASSPVLSNFIHSFTNPTRCCGISGNDRAWMQFDRHVFSILFRAPRKSLHLVFILFQSEYDIKIYSFEAVPRRTYVSRYHLLPLCSFLWSVILCPNDIRHPLPSIIMKSRVIQLETYCDIWSRPISHLRSFPGSSISPGCHLSSEYNV